MSDLHARVTWAIIAEPGDEAAVRVVQALGHEDALAWLDEAAERPAAAVASLRLAPREAAALAHGIERWSRRRAHAEVERVLAQGERVGARVVVPGDPGWPAALDDLGAWTPHALWVRGGEDRDAAWLDAAWRGSLAVVGARACTAYGQHVATEWAGEVADRGLAVVSGGAFGIDAAAHRGAMAAGGATVVVLAGGVDRLYPAGNADLITRAMRAGAVVSESPPGFAPHRSRFLSRNRLIATARATVVIEAAPRSGALSTARRAADLARPVGAVPGPVTAITSAGCHGLVREGIATLVCQARDALELVLPAGDVPPALLETGESVGAPDFRTPAERQAYDAIGGRGATLDVLAPRAGLSTSEALGALGALELRGAVRRDGPAWRRSPPANQGKTGQTQRYQ